MRNKLVLVVAVLTLFNLSYSQDASQYCGTPVPIPETYMRSVQHVVGQTYNLVFVFVDFPDGRKPDGSLPSVDADTVYFNNTTINAVGSMGYVNVNGSDPSDPSSPKRRKIRKYEYEHYWDMYFTVGTYTGTVHPDYPSHGIQVYGSIKDYYNEATYGNVNIVPYQTWSGSADKYHTGIVNRYDEANGKKYIRWIKLPSSSTSYGTAGNPNLDYIDDSETAVRALHNLPTSDPNYLEFDIDSYLNGTNNRIVYVGAGGFRSGFVPWIGSKKIWVAEKPPIQARSNAFPISALDGIQQYVHEFGHTLGIEHFVAGNYETMHWGGLGHDASYNYFYYCPPHFSPWVKLMMGWIPPANVIKVTSTQQNITLPPINQLPTIALITIYGEAGRSGNYDHSEYFLVEYRKREGFNRFAGGVSTPGFSGGALVWHYTNYNAFPIYGDQVVRNLGLKVQTFDSTFKANDGSPSHFFYPSHSTLDGSTNPSSNSAGNFATNISLSSFGFNGSNMTFNVTYAQGSIPTWSQFLQYNDVLPGTLSGNVYIEWYRYAGQINIDPQSNVHFSPTGGLSCSQLNSAASSLKLHEASSLSVSQWWNQSSSLSIFGPGTVTLPSLTISPGTTFTVASGATLAFQAGSSLFVNGILNVNGTSSQPITFTSTSGTTAASWGSIVLSGSGASGTFINNLILRYGTEITVTNVPSFQIWNSLIENTIHGVNAYNSGGVVAFCTLSMQRDHGIIINSHSAIGCEHNVITKTDNSGVAILFTSGSNEWQNRAAFNDISGYDWGITSSYGSYTRFGDLYGSYQTKNNRIRNCSWAVQAYQYSQIYMSAEEEEGYGYSSVYDNSYNAVLFSGSYIWANYNYWGWPVNANKFYVQSGCYFQYQYYPLDSNPWGGIPKFGNSISQNIATSSPGDPQPKDPNWIKEGRKLSRGGRLADAFECFKRALAKSETQTQALLEICAMPDSGFSANVEELLSSIPTQQMPLATYLYASRLSKKGQSEAAVSTLGRIPLNSPLAGAAKLMEFYIALRDEKNMQKAANLLMQLRTVQPSLGEMELALAKHDLSNATGNGVQSPTAKGESVGTDLALGQNYPNPFNPTTMISYSVPAEGFVSLRVFDILGREVVLLVNEPKSAGRYTVQWDASNMPSGIYFARLQTTDKSVVKKLMLVK